jgi:nucleotide-binding universal stress UspA family protein
VPASSSGLIVVGSAHRGALGRLTLGDAAAGTVHAAPCAVAVAPRDFASAPRSLREIAVGFDGEPQAQGALTFAEELAQAAGARVRVLAVARPAIAPDPWIGLTVDWTEQAAADRARAQRLVDQAVGGLDVPGGGEVLVGQPAAELAAASSGADLLVLGSRGFGPVRRLLLGSTSSRLIRDAACPVVVLPRAASPATRPPRAAREAAARVS